MNILVVGGGLGGTSAAIALARRGFAVSLVEGSGDAQGASITITNRGVDALEAIGVLDTVLARSVTIDGENSLFSVFRDGAGNILNVPPPPPRSDTRLPSAVIILRQELMAMMHDAARVTGVNIGIGDRLVTLKDGADGVVVGFQDGRIERYDLVVGADGLRSTVRNLVFTDASKPEYTGHMSFRWVLPDGPPGDIGFYSLPDSTTINTLRLRDGEVYLATGVDMPMARLSQGEARDLLRGVLARFEAPMIRALLARLDDEQAIIVSPYSWLLMPTPWHRGRVVLIGDAVHTTTAHMASGGSLAIEDGVVLAEELAGDGDLDTRLDRFGRRRGPRTTRVVEASVELLRLQQAGAPPAASGALRAAAVAALREPY